MWAGGRFPLSGALRCGQTAIRRSRVISVQEKQGSSGLLTFAAVEHPIWREGRAVIRERQYIVYRQASSGRAHWPADGSEVPDSPVKGEWSIDVSPTLLFRFSASRSTRTVFTTTATTRDVEGYPGLLVHGPLQAIVMVEAARAAGYPSGPGDGLEFRYRLESPLFDFEGMIAQVVPGTETKTTVHAAAGRQTANAILRRASRTDGGGEAQPARSGARSA
jgi:3-methylfumaryl-CoA hydratase